MDIKKNRKATDAIEEAVALVARNPRPFRERWDRYQERGW